MTPPGISRILIEGHTSIKRASVDLGQINVLVGANGSGKSNLVRALELLGRIADHGLASYVERSGGASMIARQPDARKINLSVRGGAGSYEASLTPTPDDRLVFVREEILPTLTTGWGARTPSVAHRESRFVNDVADDPGLTSDAPEILEMLQGCRVFHFHDTSSTAPVKLPGPTADNLALAADARNLAAFLQAMQRADRSAYRRIVGAVRQVAPFFRDFVLKEEATDRIRLRWTQADSDTVFSAHQMSDGTLRFICLATLLLQPNLPRVTVLDEPELGLHPYAIVQLADMLRAASVNSQVVIATQSVTLMDQFVLEDLIVVERGPDGSRFERPSAESLRDWLDEYSLGELWQKNLIGGRPTRDSV